MSLKASHQDILNQLKIKKNTILREEQAAKDRIAKFYQTLRELLLRSEQISIHSFNQKMLEFHQKISEALKYLSNNSNHPEDNQTKTILQFLDHTIIDGPTIEQTKLQNILMSIYQVKIDNPTAKIQQSELAQDFLDAADSDNSMGLKQSAVDLTIQKLQTERDYYQRREQELLTKLKQLQSGLGRRGINIKEMSRSYLEEKCSRWALQRLKQEKKILVEQIGQASQEIIRLNNQTGEQQLEIRKLNALLNQPNGRSGLASVTKSNLQVEWQSAHQRQISSINEQTNSREKELQLKNQQLMLQTTRLLKNQKDIMEENQKLEQQIEQCRQIQSQLTLQINQLKQLNLIVNHDYEISLRRKAAFQQECSELKHHLQQINNQAQEQKQTYKTVINDLEQKQTDIVNKVKAMEQANRQITAQLESRVKDMQIQRQTLLKRLEETTSKKGEQFNYKQLLNQQITRLLKQNATLSSSIQSKQEAVFLLKQENSRVSNDLKETNSKLDQSKRQCVRLKKQNKDLDKRVSELEKKITDHTNLEYKVAQLQQNFIMLQSQFIKYKQSADKKVSVSLRSIQIIKERFSIHLNAIIADQVKTKPKKAQSKIELIEKYIDEMASLSNKSALIKQLKEENRLLKEGKEAKIISRKSNYLFTEQTVVELQNGLWSIATKILEERLKSQKDLFDLELRELKQKIGKEEVQKLQLQQQLDKQKQKATAFKSQHKQQSPNQQVSKMIKLNEQKMQRMDNELKANRAMIRKLQTQITQYQAEIKIKKQLSLGLKKQCKQKEDIIRQLQSELSTVQEELQKAKRNAKEISKKQIMFKEIKEKQMILEQKNITQKKTIQGLEEKIKIITKQLEKKQAVLKQLRSIDDKQNKAKQDEKIREDNQIIIEQRQTIRKIKAQIDRKDQIIKNLRFKAESRSKQLQALQSNNQRETQKNRKQLQIVERKLEATKSTAKRQQSKNYLLTIALKKVYQYFCQLNSRQEATVNKKKRESTQYFSGSSASSHALKSVTPINTKAIPHYEGLAILNLSTQDLMQLHNEPLYASKTHVPLQSFEIGSPSMQKAKVPSEEILLQGLQQLQKTLGLKQIDTNTIVNIFKRVLQV